MASSKKDNLRDKVKIIIKGEDKTDSIREWSESGGKFRVVYSNNKTYFYSLRNIQIKPTVLSNDRVFDCFEYLKCIAGAVGLQDERVGNILLNNYSKIEYIDEEDNIFSSFLTGKLRNDKKIPDFTAIYPFGFNISQKMAVDNALANPLSIIEGPPGTGKTQTILNIIANAVMRGESVAVVSSNNSATKNVLEKLEKYKVDFIAAYLGNSENKAQFIESQKPLPDLLAWELLPEQESTIKRLLQNLYTALNEKLLKRNALSQLKQDLDTLETEYKHFEEFFEYDDKQVTKYLKLVDSDAALELWLLCEEYAEKNKRPGFFAKLFNRFLRGVISKEFYSLSPDIMIAICQKRYYMTKTAELMSEVSSLERDLDHFNFNKKMTDYSELSAKLFRNELAKKYKNATRHKFGMDDLWKSSESFIKEYPVILATTYSLRSSLSQKIVYDYVIIDEASQVDLATGALALSCAKKVVVVGDLKQLPNVVDSDSAYKTDIIFAKFGLPEVYRYKNHSLLSAVSEMFPSAPRTLLREHYRCHPKIIGFCNQKFYDNKLIVLTEPKSEHTPLIVYKTAPGNHARERMNQRQIDVIRDEIIPKHGRANDNKSVGIVTPYRNQTNALQEAFAGTGIQADTVDKFQGRENDIIIISTVDNEISEFADNSNRLNVAVSRAIDQLTVVINGGDDARDTNIGDLVNYIEYNNFEIIQSEIYSIFDYLYKNYRDKRIEFLQKQQRISQYDSENLMYALIREVLSDDNFTKFDVANHIPLRMIFRDMTRLDDDERQYAGNVLTHTDFIIFDKCGKTPRLAIEVDGVSFHKEGTRQAERDKMKNKIFEKYNLPLVRFKTNESGEKDRLILKLNEVMGI